MNEDNRYELSLHDREIHHLSIIGPLFLKNNQKSWVILFACAINSAGHFELVTSASTEAFLMALQRFLSRKGRYSTILRQRFQFC